MKILLTRLVVLVGLVAAPCLSLPLAMGWYVS